jgi:hypothetical protein
MKKAMYDIEDLVWYVAFVLIITMVFILISVPGCKNKLTQRISVSTNDLENSIASQELNGFLNARLPPTYEEFSENFNAAKIIFQYDSSASKAKVLDYIKDNYDQLGDKSIAEFIGYMYYNYDTIESLGNMFPDSVFSAVLIGVLNGPACKYPSTSSVDCQSGRYESPAILVQFLTGDKTKNNVLDGEYLVDVNAILNLKASSSVYQLVPLPDNSIAYVTYDRMSDVK